jgi:DNA-binding transcriptional MerR regulator
MSVDRGAAGVLEAAIARLSRKEVASRLGIGMGSLLFYEKKGLIPPPGRSVNGYRVYRARDVDRLSLILRAKGLGLSLREISEFLEGIDAGRPREELRAGIERKVEDLQRKIDELEEAKRALLEMAASPRLGDCDAIRAVAASSPEAASGKSTRDPAGGSASARDSA